MVTSSLVELSPILYRIFSGIAIGFFAVSLEACQGHRHAWGRRYTPPREKPARRAHGRVVALPKQRHKAISAKILVDAKCCLHGRAQRMKRTVTLCKPCFNAIKGDYDRVYGIFLDVIKQHDEFLTH